MWLLRGLWKGDEVDVALKVKHCNHYKHTLAKLEMSSLDALVRRISINTEGVLAGEIKAICGKSIINIKDMFGIKDNRVGLKFGFGESF